MVLYTAFEVWSEDKRWLRWEANGSKDTGHIQSIAAEETLKL